MRGVSVLLFSAALGACSTAPQPGRSAKAEAHLQKLLAGKVAGPAVSCLPNYRSEDMVAIDDNTILFREGNRRIWRNDLNGGTCNGVASGSYALVTNRFGGLGLCRGDIGPVVDLRSGMTVGSCAMGDFVPYASPRG